jgi:hypothetical protein
MDFKEELRFNEINRQAIVSIEMIAVMLNNTKSSFGRTIEQSIKRANEDYKNNFIKARKQVLALVDWNIRPHVLYRINKYYEHLL